MDGIKLMKLTTKKLYQLIQEALANYNTSEQSFYSSGLKQIMDTGSSVYKTPNGDSLNLPWLEENIGKRIGGGYSREVFNLNNDMVIKIATPEELHDGSKSNGLEARLFNEYPKVFPRTYVFDRQSDDPEWIVVEKLIPIDDYDLYEEVLNNAFPTLAPAAKILNDGGFIVKDVSFNINTMKQETKMLPITSQWVFERVLDAYGEGPLSSPSTEWINALESTSAGQKVGKVDKDYIINESWKTATNDLNLITFMTVNKDLGVDFEELRIGNLATNDEKNILVSIDISIFKF